MWINLCVMWEFDIVRTRAGKTLYQTVAFNKQLIARLDRLATGVLRKLTSALWPLKPEA